MSFVRNGIYGSAALDLSQIEGGARRRGNLGVDEADGAANQRVYRIGHAEVRPTVAAGAVDDDFETARGERDGGDVIGASAVQNDDGFEAVAVGIDKGAHAAEVAFAFFPDVGHEKNGALRLDLRLVDGASDGHERSEARTIIRNARCEHAAAFAPNFDVRPSGEDGI